MGKEKMLLISPDIEKILTDLCDSALKKEGMNMIRKVNQLIVAIQENGVTNET
jgi:hypothetical protein